MSKKRCVLWDYKNTLQVPWAMDNINFNGPISSVSNWNTWVPPELKGRSAFRPMVHLESQLSGQDWENVLNTDQPIIHFFNEPERNGISAEHAANIWNQQMVPLRNNKGKKLVSPSCSNDDAGQAWLADFMNRVSDNPPDYLGLHYYSTDGYAAIRFLESMHDKYPNQPIIVSEIASIARTKNDVYGFTIQLANYMDAADWIFEYGFFGCMPELADNFVSPEAQLMNKDGTFTHLMNKLMNKQPLTWSGVWEKEQAGE